MLVYYKKNGKELIAVSHLAVLGETGAAATGLEALGTIFTQLMSWVSSLVTTITASPLLLLPVGIFVAGAVIGLAGRLIGR